MSQGRDLEVATLVARFGTMTAAHIRAVIFAKNASHTASSRVISRLLERGWLERCQYRLLPDARPGSGEYVYKVGRYGWRQIGQAVTRRKVDGWDRHSLAIADLFVRLKAAEFARRLEILEYQTEPDSWVTVGGQELRPDLYARIGLEGGVHRYWFEVDLGTEHQKHVTEKLRRYARAYQAADAASGEWRYFPRVLFEVPDARRKAAIQSWIDAVNDDAGLFAVVTREELPPLLTCPQQAL